jgi:O-phospho-L-seryl-tRNASec:L-selenocysteinyl-tRNA synthase
LLVPVGGSIVAGFCKNMVDEISKSYPGRASASQTLDVFMTLLSLGKNGYMKLVQDRKDVFFHLRNKLRNIAHRYNEKILLTKKNPISLAMTLENFDKAKLTMIGSMLFTRGVSGCRVITTTDVKNVGDFKFKGWGSHSSHSNVPYLTAAAALGMTKDEVDVFTEKLDKILLKVRGMKVAVKVNTF